MKLMIAKLHKKPLPCI